jgi:type II secretory ATPase GspE/PulE/Tfp pilus assembly ATPase PilB-like protein
MQELNLTRADVEGKAIFKAVGCPECLQTGYEGRTAIHEIMPITDEARELITSNADAVSLKKMVMRQGMRTLREAAIRKMLEGITTVEEVLLTTQEDVKRSEL